MRPYLSFLIKNKTLRYTEFRYFLAMRVALILALNMQMTIVFYMVYQLTGDPLSLGIIGLCEVVPAVGFSFISGQIADRFEKRNMLLCCILGFMLTSVIYLVLSSQAFQGWAGLRVTVWLLYANVFIGGVARAFQSPANFSLLGLVVPRKHYANAATWSSTFWQLGAVLGPLTGGAIMAMVNYVTSFSLVLGIQVLSLVALVKISRKPFEKKKKEPMLQSLKEGLNFVFRTQVILAALALDMFAVLFGGAVALLPAFAEDILKVSAVGYGWLRAAPGIGTIITLLVLSVMPLKHNAGKKLLVALMGYGLTIIIFGLSENFYLSFIMLMLSGALDGVSVAIRWTILQLYTPDDMRGRVAAVNTMFISSSNELGAAESGFTAKIMGLVRAVVFGGIVTLGVVGITWWKAPKLRNLQLDGKI